MATPSIPGMSDITQTYYSQLIDALMTTERRPLERLQAQRSATNTLLGAYTALNDKFEALGKALEALQTAASSVWSSRAVTVADKSDAARTILSATAVRGATSGAYDVAVTALATSHRVVGDQVASATAPLGLQGEFTVGGAESRAVSTTAPSSAVAAFGVGDVRAGQTELGRGAYHVEVRDEGGALQFRLVDARGQAVRIADASDPAGARMTAGWQNLETVAGTTLDTGRGLTITFQPLTDHAVALDGTLEGALEGVALSGVAAGQAELASGAYRVEVREDGAGGWQFRLVDAEGAGVAIYDAARNDGAYTADWQDLAAARSLASDGRFVTGRGLTLHLGEGPGAAGSAALTYTARSVQPGVLGAGATEAAYTAQGARIRVNAADTLQDVAQAISAATYAEGEGVSATVVDRRLVLTAASTGAAHDIVVSKSAALQALGLIDASGAYRNTAAAGEPGYVGYRAPSDAAFSVNGIAMTRPTNTNLSDVIAGVTLDLAPDAAGASARIEVRTDVAGIKAALTAFTSAFNGLQATIKTRTSVALSGSGQETTYTRSALSSDTVLKSVRARLYSLFAAQMGPAGSGVTSLRDLGITLNATLEASLSDPAALEAALARDPRAVEACVSAVSRALAEAIAPFTATDGIMDTRIAQANARVGALDARTKALEERLERRQAFYATQFAHAQVQLAQMSATRTSLLAYWGLNQGS